MFNKMFTTRLVSVRRPRLHQFTSTVGNTSREPYRRGIIYTIIAIIIMMAGVVMTILGFTDVLGTGITMMGMLMVAVAVLLFLGALRMFLLAAKLRKTERTVQISHGTVASMVIEHEDEIGTLTVVMDTVNIAARCRRRSEDEDKPPDYHEATSDLYPESTSEIILDSVNDDPPPPYGLPTYDQAVANKDMESGESKHESETSEGQSLQETSGITSVQEISGSTSTLGPNAAINQSQEQEESLAPGYQDMPHVTI